MSMMTNGRSVHIVSVGLLLAIVAFSVRGLNAQQSAPDSRIAIGTIPRFFLVSNDVTRLSKARALVTELQTKLFAALQDSPTFEFFDRDALGVLERELGRVRDFNFDKLSGPAIGLLRRLDILTVMEHDGHESVLVKAIEVQTGRVLASAICKAGLLTNADVCLPGIVSQLRSAGARILAERSARIKAAEERAALEAKAEQLERDKEEQRRAKLREQQAKESNERRAAQERQLELARQKQAMEVEQHRLQQEKEQAEQSRREAAMRALQPVYEEAKSRVAPILQFWDDWKRRNDGRLRGEIQAAYNKVTLTADRCDKLYKDKEDAQLGQCLPSLNTALDELTQYK